MQFILKMVDSRYLQKELTRDVLILIFEIYILHRKLLLYIFALNKEGNLMFLSKRLSEFELLKLAKRFKNKLYGSMH